MLAWAMTLLLILSSPVTFARAVPPPTQKPAPCAMESMQYAIAMPMHAEQGGKGDCACCHHTDCGCSVSTAAPLFTEALRGVPWFVADRDELPATSAMQPKTAASPPLRPPIA